MFPLALDFIQKNKPPESVQAINPSHIHEPRLELPSTCSRINMTARFGYCFPLPSLLPLLSLNCRAPESGPQPDPVEGGWERGVLFISPDPYSTWRRGAGLGVRVFGQSRVSFEYDDDRFLCWKTILSNIHCIIFSPNPRHPAAAMSEGGWPKRRAVQLLLLLLSSSVGPSQAFYLPGLAPVNFCEADQRSAKCPVGVWRRAFDFYEV